MIAVDLLASEAAAAVDYEVRPAAVLEMAPSRAVSTPAMNWIPGQLCASARVRFEADVDAAVCLRRLQRQHDGVRVFSMVRTGWLTIGVLA